MSGDYESHFRERAETAEAALSTARSANKPLKEEVQKIKETFGIRKRGDRYQINYDTLVKAIGFEGALELRKIIDAAYNVSGEAGEKPRVRIPAPAQEAAA